jgi:hypothetical protein
MKTSMSLASLVALTAFALAPYSTHAQHFDVFLARPAAGTSTVIGGADVTGLAYNDVTRIFEVELASAGGEFLALEPGINHPNVNDPGLTYPASATALQPGDVLRLTESSFTVAGNTDDLFFWNGVGAPAFAPAAANFRIDGGDPGVGGVFDEHPFLVVDSDATPGVYLASVVGMVDGFAPSVPVYLVMGTEELITPAFLGITQAEFDMLTEDDLDEALEAVIEAGIEYVETNVVPEPASTALLACSILGAALLRCRTRSA